MTSLNSVYPQAVVSWTARRDQEDIVFANDPNSLAAEIIAIETTLGVNPQIEKAPIVGNPVNYGTVDSRISAVQQAQQLPVCGVYSQYQDVDNTVHPDGELTGFTSIYDPYKMFNGTDITVPVTGWYLITCNLSWDWWDTGWARHGCYVNGTGGLLADNFIRYDLPFNEAGQWWFNRQFHSDITWQGHLQANSRISIYLENGSTKNQLRAYRIAAKVACLQKISGSYTTPVTF